MTGDAFLTFTIPSADFPDRHATLTVTHSARPGEERSYVLTRTQELQVDILAAEVMTSGKS